MASRSGESIYAETLAVFDERENPFEPLTTPEVAAALGANRRTVYKRLQKLADSGQIDTKETGANSRVWWRPPADSATSQPTESAPDVGWDSTRKGRPIRMLLDEAPDGIVVHTATGEILEVNDTLTEMLGYTRETLLSMQISDVEIKFDERTLREYWKSMDSGAMEKIRVEGLQRRKDGSTYPAEVWVSRVAIDDGKDQFIAHVREITERKKRDRELERYERIIDAVGDPVYELDANGEVTYVNNAFLEITGFERDDIIGQYVSRGMVEADIARAESLIRKVLSSDSQENATIEYELQTKDGEGIPVENHFTALVDEDGEFYGTAGILRDISERKTREQELKRQREQLEALNHIHEVVRGITDVAIDQSTRNKIEQVVCNQLIASDSYTFAGICAADSQMQFEPRAQAGFGTGTQESSFFCGVDAEINQTPIERAMRTGEMVTSQHILDDAEFEFLHEHARKHSYHSLALIPISHEDTIYGVLAVATERPDAFAEGGREVIARLGEVVGHAIAAVERKRALLGDEVVELGFRMHDFEKIGLPTGDDGKIVFDRIVPLEENTYLEYGTATGDMMETVRALVDVDLTPHSGPINIISESDEQTRFELRLTDPLFLPAIVDVGGYVHEVRIEDDEYHIRIHLPPSVNVRRIVDVVTDSYPTAQMVTRRQTTPTTPKLHRHKQRLVERLTDRQEAVLKAGYFGGFFEWPREQSGEELAQSLGIGASTFHQHMRKAEKKLLDQLFNET